MRAQSDRHERPVTDELHPRIYLAIVGLTVWMVLSIWALFSGSGYVGLIFAVVTLFFLIALGLPALIWLTWRRNTEAAEQGPSAEALHVWMMREFSTWTGELSGRAAAMQILLPIVAVALGMTIFGLVFAFAVPAS